MEKKKWATVLRIVLAILVYAAILFSVLWLPRKFGVEWIIGWPTLISQLLCIPIGTLIAILILPRSLRSKRIFGSEEKPAPTKQQKTRGIIVLVLQCVFYFWLFIGQPIWMSFSKHEKVDHYLFSPNGKNRAVVTARKDDSTWVEEDIYPARTWFFYERDKGVFINPHYSEDVAFTWLDDDTLEITRINKESGEAETETLRW